MPPTIAALKARIEDLPALLAATARAFLAGPGTTAHLLLYVAERLDHAVDECRTYDRPLADAEAAALESLANILRDAAPRFPHPPRVPLTAEEADASIRRCATAAGLSTACGVPGQ